ncbi:MAG: PhoU domain-containing protein, partial [Bacteroidales bacterium]|nr:PhoU domain-containing protein [Bacteroidales bacterium]
IACFVSKYQSQVYGAELLKALRFDEMCHCVLEMFSYARTALYQEDSSCAEKVLTMDELVDEINANATTIIAAEIAKNSNRIEEMLKFLAVINKIERMGDRIANIVEDVVFYLDFKELRHLPKKVKKDN